LKSRSLSRRIKKMPSISKLIKTKIKFMEALEIPMICRLKLTTLLISGKPVPLLTISWSKISMKMQGSF
jgi:hypothetical protein